MGQSISHAPLAVGRSTILHAAWYTIIVYWCVIQDAICYSDRWAVTLLAM